jgi:hypothetical protein
LSLRAGVHRELPGLLHAGAWCSELSLVRRVTLRFPVANGSKSVHAHATGAAPPIGPDARDLTPAL